MPQAKFDLEAVEAITIRKIARRALDSISELPAAHVLSIDLQRAITACHAGPCRLDLARLLYADDLTFAGDVLGIRRHMDIAAGRLTGGLWPRCARRARPSQQAA